jgi:hypothetical protein
LDLADDDHAAVASDGNTTSSNIITVGTVWKWRKKTSTDIGHLLSDDRGRRRRGRV